MQGLGEDEEQRHKKLYNKKKGKNKVVWLIVKNKIKKKDQRKNCWEYRGGRDLHILGRSRQE